VKKQSLFLVFATLGIALTLSVPREARAEVFVRIGPPRPVVERVVPAPGPRFVWVGGYYRWSGRAYVWVPGRWVVPPHARAVWVAPAWAFVPARGGYVFIAGHWR
jgi:hypothetical protein